MYWVSAKEIQAVSVDIQTGIAYYAVEKENDKLAAIFGKFMAKMQLMITHTIGGFEK